ncbi:delta-60 repeat domain-containing protein [Deinococcus roseus]|uniref:Delta-60 repeat domain-containing protein n=1 Tax=Deinococcus roseus TaxID=392414 RepID=A0ABQ2D4E5_9DEIO|nr:delta-60 repeat domain-containing protein [Deinococcus roseus]GGJ38570.1 hypothetical protein GCM10008938_25860 [Deinococcus roseus]
MNKRFCALLALTTLLAACGTTPRVNQVTPPSNNPSNILGYVDMTIGENPQFQWVQKDANGQFVPQSLEQIPQGIDLQLLSNGNPWLDNDHERILMSTYKVRNGKGSTAYPQQKNVTFLAMDSYYTIDHTSIISMRDAYNQVFYSSAVANRIMPTHGSSVSISPNSIEPNHYTTMANSAYSDLVYYTENEIQHLQGTNNVFPWGFAVRHCLNTSCTSYDRTLPANPNLYQYDGKVTFAYKVPFSACLLRSVHVLFMVVKDDAAAPRIVQSEDEQANKTIAGLGSAPAGWNVLKLNGSTLSGGTLLQNVRITGTSSSPEVVISKNTAPTGINVSSTNVASYTAGAVVGNLTPVDSGVADIYSYTVSDSRFEVVAGVLKLKADQAIGLTPTSIPLTVTVTDSAGGTFNKSLNIAVVPSGGLRDHTFGGGLGIDITSVSSNDDQSFGLDLQSQGNNAGKIIQVGQTFNLNMPGTGNVYDFALVRHNADGSLDTSFGTGGMVIDHVSNVANASAGSDTARTIKVLPDDSILVAGIARGGSSTSADFALVKYTSNGTRDLTFGSSGKVLSSIGAGSAADQANGIAVLNDGRILLAGTTVTSTGRDFALALYSPNGVLDSTFGTGGKKVDVVSSGHDEIAAVALDANGKIVVAGYTTVAGSTDVVVARYNTDGTPDSTFGTAGKTVTSVVAGNDRASGLVIQSDGKIVVSGTAVNNTTDEDFVAVRYNANGTLDSTFGNAGTTTVSFGAGTGVDQSNALALQNDGKLLLVGRTKTGVGSYDLALARLNANGTLDNTYGKDGKVITSAAPSSDTAQAVKVLGDNKIILTGSTFIDGKANDFVLARYIP